MRSIGTLWACALSLLVLTGCATTHKSPAQSAGPDWRTTLDRELPRLGHRNWIVIADSAYPLQSRPGIVTIYAGGDQLAVVKEVLERVGRSGHVSPIVWLDAELPKVSDKDAPGIANYRAGLERVLTGREPRSKPHMEIIKSLDDSAALFSVLVIKTDLELPYTSVFLELDCGYWDAAREAKLRAAPTP